MTSMIEPHRIQRKRTKDWRMPENAIYVGRGSRWGNPYRVGQIGQFEWEPLTDDELLKLDLSPRRIRVGGQVLTCQPVMPNRIVPFPAPLTIEDVILRYHKHLLEKQISVEPLRGKHLACWCRLDQPCHADTLLELANK